MWKLSIEDDQGNKTVVNLVRDNYSVGRGDENTVRLTERNISRKHAILQKNGAGWVLQDQQSYNGCFVNGVRVSEAQPLDHGDLVQLGDYRLVVTDDAADHAEAAPTAAATVPAIPKSHTLLDQPDRLVMVAGPTPGAEYALGPGPMLVGRGEECDIAINHGSVSRVHAEIHPFGDGRYEIIDKESANGVRVNGVELQRSIIDARDTIELGDVQLKFIPKGVIYRIGADESQRIDGLAFERMSAPGVQMHAPAPALPGIVKVGAIAALLGVALILGMFVLRGRSDGPEPPTAEGTDSAARILAEAKEALGKGDTEGAHAKVLEIPESSNARKSAEFREVEAAWADDLFDQAEKELDPKSKRLLLERIAKTTTVDPGRRRLADEKIAALDEAVDISDLPSEQRVKLEQQQKEAAQLQGGLVRKNPFGDDPAPAPAPAGAPAPKPKGVSAPEPNTKDMATSGDRDDALRAKRQYEAKANSGKATLQDLRMLRALCGQLNDAACRAKANSLIAQKKSQGE